MSTHVLKLAVCLKESLNLVWISLADIVEENFQVLVSLILDDHVV
jgi:hypothetical protein